MEGKLKEVRAQLHVGPEETRVAEDLFNQYCDQQRVITPGKFQELMTRLGVKPEYALQYFCAFDRRKSGALQYPEFELGLIALDPHAPHDGVVGEQRLRFIFDVYDLNKDGSIDSEEFVHMVRHIRRATGHDTSREAVFKSAQELAKEMVSGQSQPSISFADFVGAVKSHRFRGTSHLFRLPRPVVLLSRTTTTSQQPQQQRQPNNNNQNQTNNHLTTNSSSSSPASPASGNMVLNVYSASGTTATTTTFPIAPQTPIRDGANKPTQSSPDNNNNSNTKANTTTNNNTDNSGAHHQSPSLVESPVGAKHLVATPRSKRGDEEPRTPASNSTPKKVTLHDVVLKAPTPSQKQRYNQVRDVSCAARIKISELSSSLFSPQNESQVSKIAMAVVNALLLSGQSPSMGQFDIVTPAEIIQVCHATARVLEGEQTCVRLRAPAKVFGDIHGQMDDLLAFFSAYGMPHESGDIAYNSYVFIGDFVDRGTFSLEVVLLLFSLKLLHPSRVYLIRGNHEDREVNALYGFQQSCVDRLPDGTGMGVWDAFNSSFDWLPLAAVISDSILCVHGGLGNTVKSISEIDNVSRPLSNPKQFPLCMDLLWSDPTDNDAVLGTHANARGECLTAFGPDRVESFCEENQIQMIIRAHQCVKDGYEYFAKGKLITVFSATNYCGVHSNDGAIVQIDDNLRVYIKVVEAKPVPVPTWSNTTNVSPLKQRRE